MQEMDEDLALLREYAARNSETAFAEVISRRGTPSTRRCPTGQESGVG
jgi:hypothetical protein